MSPWQQLTPPTPPCQMRKVQSCNDVNAPLTCSTGSVVSGPYQHGYNHGALGSPAPTPKNGKTRESRAQLRSRPHQDEVLTRSGSGCFESSVIGTQTLHFDLKWVISQRSKATRVRYLGLEVTNISLKTLLRESLLIHFYLIRNIRNIRVGGRRGEERRKVEKEGEERRGEEGRKEQRRGGERRGWGEGEGRS